MKEQTKTLLTVKEKETVKNMGRVADYIGNIIEKGDIALEKKIIACNKSVEDCWKYITAKAREEAINGYRVIDDETVFGWAVHFYDENGAEMAGYEDTVQVYTTKDTSYRYFRIRR